MKVNISIISVDIKLVEEAISKFYIINGKAPSFIIMNKETKEKIQTKSNIVYTGLTGRPFDSIDDIPVACSEYLDFGEVEVI